MDSALEDLYQEVILDHTRRPRNFGPLAGATATEHGTNPLCGDAVTIHLRLTADGTIEAAGFEGQGCSISQSSASILTTLLPGRSLPEARELAQAFRAYMQGDDAVEEALGDLAALGGVRRFPVRIRCAALAWNTLDLALDNAAAS